jgi:hypothetical protein
LYPVVSAIPITCKGGTNDSKLPYAFPIIFSRKMAAGKAQRRILLRSVAKRASLRPSTLPATCLSSHPAMTRASHSLGSVLLPFPSRQCRRVGHAVLQRVPHAEVRQVQHRHPFPSRRSNSGGRSGGVVLQVGPVEVGGVEPRQLPPSLPAGRRRGCRVVRDAAERALKVREEGRLACRASTQAGCHNVALILWCLCGYTASIAFCAC